MKRNLIIPILMLLTARGGAEVLLETDRSDIGARALGMGRAFVALSGESDSIFGNPAGLASISGRGFTAMYSKAQGQSDNFLLGGVTSGQFGTIGAGFQFSSIFGPPNVVLENNRTLSLTSTGNKIDFYSSTVTLAFARSFFNLFSAGVSFKLFQHAFLHSAGMGTGIDSDFGLLYPYDEHLAFGFLQRNCLAGLGSKINWSSGISERITNATRVGASYSYDKFIFSADFEFYPSSRRSGILMFGAQYVSSPDLTVRLGMDQLDATTNNFTGGFSYTFGPARLDYSLHQYSPTSLNTSAFSLSYLTAHPKAISAKTTPEVLSTGYISLAAPADRTITAQNDLSFIGSLDAAVARLEINSSRLSPEAGTFEASLPLALGKNTFILVSYDRSGRKTELKKIRVLNLPAFPDVTPDNWAYYPIAMIDLLGIVTGGRDGLFNPAGNITRTQLAQILDNLAETGRFSSASAASQPTDPQSLISRAEAVAVMVRLTALPLPEVSFSPFPDVSGRYWAASEISAAQQAGWLQYWEGKNFEPEKKITRAELCHILSRIAPIRSLIAESFDFSRGY